MDQSLSSLCYRLLAGPVRLEPLRVLAARSIVWGGWRVTFHILGASHAVRLERGAARLTELLTCAPAEGEAGVIADDRPVPGFRFRGCVSGCAFEVSARAFSLAEEGDGLRGPFAPGCRMEYAFETSPGGATPRTRIGWQAAATELRVETVHTYPEEGRGVRTRTVFALREEESR